MESLKIVLTSTFYPPYHVGGACIHTYLLANELGKLGHEVHVIHSIDSYYWQRKHKSYDIFENNENVIVHSIKSPFRKISPLLSYIFGSPYPVASKIREIINEVKPDVLHHHNIAGLGPFVLGIQAPRVLYTAHDYWLVCPRDILTKQDKTHCNSNSNCFICSIKSDKRPNFLGYKPPQLWRHTGILNKYIKNIDTIIAPSNFTKNRLQELGLNGNFSVIPNFVPLPKKNETKLYDFQYFLFVGRLEEYKGILNLINEFMRMKDDIDAKLLIVGSGSLEDKIREIISNSECGNKIIMLGRVDDIPLANLYENTLAVLIPSTWPENCPLVALESLANGKPFIAFNTGGIPEIVQMSQTGVAVETIEEFIDAMIKISNDHKYRNSLMKNAIEAYSNYYSAEVFMDKYLKLLN